MKVGDKVAIVACSNGLAENQKKKIQELCDTLMGIGLIPILSKYIFVKDSVFGGTAQERAESLMEFYRDEEVKAIFDVSGGDIANEVLPYLDFNVIGKSEKQFWGYSDLTTIINAIYAKTGKESVLYQVRNLVYEHAHEQVARFNKEEMCDFRYEFVQGQKMQGIVVGGNIRCLLKLAGTEYWPDTTGKILLLEAMGGTVPQMVTYLNQLKQMGVFKKISGILLGTFSKMEAEECKPTIVELVKMYAGTELPIAKTQEIGHGTDSKGIVIGRKYYIAKNAHEIDF